MERPVIPWSRYRSMDYQLEKKRKEKKVVVEVKELERPVIHWSKKERGRSGGQGTGETGYSME